MSLVIRYCPLSVVCLSEYFQWLPSVNSQIVPLPGRKSLGSMGICAPCSARNSHLPVSTPGLDPCFLQLPKKVTEIPRQIIKKTYFMVRFLAMTRKPDAALHSARKSKNPALVSGVDRTIYAEPTSRVFVYRDHCSWKFHPG